MKLTKKRFWLLAMSSIIPLCLLWQGMASAQSSTNYRIDRALIDTGGGERSSFNYTLCDSLGQSSGAIVSTSAQYIHIPGFYECFVQNSPPGPEPPPGTVIPEPNTFILLGTGLLIWFIYLRRKWRKQASHCSSS